MKKQKLYNLGLLPIKISESTKTKNDTSDLLDDIRDGIDNQLGFANSQISHIKATNFSHFIVKLDCQDAREVEVCIFIKEKKHNDMIYINSTTFLSEDNIIEQSSCIEQYVANKINDYVLNNLIEGCQENKEDYYQETIH